MIDWTTFLLTFGVIWMKTNYFFALEDDFKVGFIASKKLVSVGWDFFGKKVD